MSLQLEAILSLRLIYEQRILPRSKNTCCDVNIQEQLRAHSLHFIHTHNSQMQWIIHLYTHIFQVHCLCTKWSYKIATRNIVIIQQIDIKLMGEKRLSLQSASSKSTLIMTCLSNHINMLISLINSEWAIVWIQIPPAAFLLYSHCTFFPCRFYGADKFTELPSYCQKVLVEIWCYLQYWSFTKKNTHSLFNKR